jgi:hypothetical protein
MVLECCSCRCHRRYVALGLGEVHQVEEVHLEDE